jgi:hypothetical protein
MGKICYSARYAHFELLRRLLAAEKVSVCSLIGAIMDTAVTSSSLDPEFLTW